MEYGNPNNSKFDIKGSFFIKDIESVINCDKSSEIKIPNAFMIKLHNDDFLI